jgi:MFS family permease
MDAASIAGIVAVFLMIIGFPVGTGYIADRKGRRFVAWAAVGFFLGIIGLLIAVLVPAKKPAY